MKLYTLLLSILVSGCTSISTNIIGTKIYEYPAEKIEIDTKYSWYKVRRTCNRKPLTELDIVAELGKAEEVDLLETGKVLSYEKENRWVGFSVMIYLGIPIPIPLYLPLGFISTDFYISEAGVLEKVVVTSRHEYFSAGVFYGATSSRPDYYEGFWFGNSPRSLKGWLGEYHTDPLDRFSYCSQPNGLTSKE